MSSLIDLPSIGKVVVAKLIEVGIETPEQLREVGSKEAFIRIRANDPTACLHMLYGLQGAILGVKDNFLSSETKEDLKGFFKTL